MIVGHRRGAGIRSFVLVWHIFEAQDGLFAAPGIEKLNIGAPGSDII